jgi:hypothetical protein
MALPTMELKEGLNGNYETTNNDEGKLREILF